MTKHTAGKQSTKQKILEQIAKYDGVISVGLVAQDLSITVETVKKYTKILIGEALVELGWDDAALCLTLAERGRRSAINPMDALIARLGVR